MVTWSPTLMLEWVRIFQPNISGDENPRNPSKKSWRKEKRAGCAKLTFPTKDNDLKVGIPVRAPRGCQGTGGHSRAPAHHPALSAAGT